MDKTFRVRRRLVMTKVLIVLMMEKEGYGKKKENHFFDLKEREKKSWFPNLLLLLSTVL